jgi:hypothetical protein
MCVLPTEKMMGGDCHKRKWVDDAHGYSAAISDDGLLIDANHPFNKSRP